MAQNTQPAAQPQGAQGADVVVTAEHRQTKLQKVPVAVSVFTGASRDRTGISTVQDVTNFAPGFSYDTVTVNAGMRGVTRQSFNVTDDSRVAAYEDEFFVYSPYNLALSSLFFSQEQIERGPQNVGGRNSEGGSIDMIAVRPTDHPYAEVRGTIGNFNQYEIEGAASDQIAPNLNARIAGNWNYQGDGYYKNVVPGMPSEGHKINEWHIEGSYDWRPTPNFDWYGRLEFGAWNQDAGDAGTRQFLDRGSWDEVNLVDANVGTATGPLMFNPAYGYADAAISPTAALGAALNNLNLVFPQELPIPGTTVLANQNVLNNPSMHSNTQFADMVERTAQLQNFDGFTTIMTYHFPKADLKYIGGVQGYDYTLNLADDESNVIQYTLPGSTGISPLAGILLPPGTGNQQGAADFVLGGSTAGLPAPSTLTINPNIHTLFIENNWWYSHELSLQSTDNSPFQYTIGGIYYFQQYSQNDTLTDRNQSNLLQPLSVLALSPAATALTGGIFAPGTVTSGLFNAAANPQQIVTAPRYQMQTRSIAGYAQVSYRITDTLKITGNLRYSYDYKWGNEEDRTVAFGGGVLGAGNTPASSLYNFLIPLYGAQTPSYDLSPLAFAGFTGPLAPGVKTHTVINPVTGFASRSLGASDNVVTGGVGLEWTPTNEIFTYARYNRGYAPISFASGGIAPNPLVNPEYLDSYELGYKQSFGRTLSIDIAAFYYNYSQIQLPVTIQTQAGPAGAFINYPKAESTGVEVEAIWNPVRDFIMTLSYSYDYTALMTACNVNTGANCYLNNEDQLATGPGARPALSSGGVVFQSVKGSPLPNAPRNKFALTGAYTLHFDPGNLTLAATYVWRDSQIGGTIFNTPYNTAPSWSDVDLRATWAGNHDRYEVIGFVRNVFNTLQYPTGPTGYGLFGNQGSGTTAGAGLIYNSVYSFNPPRTFGVELRYKFF